MCGRYVLVTSIKKLEDRFNAKADDADQFQPRVNIGPGSMAPVLTNEEPERLQFFQFGLTPFWAKKKMYFFNARAEGDHNKENKPDYNGAMGIVKKPAFRHSIRKKRCLIPADAFIEGPEKERLSKPYTVYLKNKQRPFAFAGLWDSWTDKETGEVLNSFSIITTVANELLQKIGHHRSPVILHPGHEKDWLETELPLSDITGLLQPYPAEEMNAYPIDPKIKNPREEGLELIEPIGERLEPEEEDVLYKRIELEGMGMTRARKRK